MKQAAEEMETCLNMTGDDHNTWHVFSDDPMWQRRLEAIGAILTKTERTGGKHYTLRSDQVLLRTGKKQLSKEAKAQLAERLRSMRNGSVVLEPEQVNRAS